MLFILSHKQPLGFAILASIAALCGDFIESKLNSGIALAIVDNATHSLVACLTWTAVLSHTSSQLSQLQKFLEIIICGGLASVLDIDHFISAKSLHLSDATKLHNRPPFHNTSAVIIIFLLLQLLAHFFSPPMNTLGWILLAAGLSHHIRDASRRGFWLWPLGATPPVPYKLYIALQGLFPILIIILRNMMKQRSRNYVHVETV